MAIWLVLLIASSLVLGRKHKHADPLDALDLDELLVLKEAYENELAVGGDSESDSSELFDSSSDLTSSDLSDSDDDDDDDDDDDSDDDDSSSEESVGMQDKDGWIIYPEWSQWDPLGDNHGYHPTEEQTADREPRHRSYHRHHRRPRRRRRYHRRNYRRRPRERRLGRNRRRSRRHYDDDDTSEEVAVGSSELQNLLFEIENDLAEMDNYLFDEDSEEAVGAEMPDYLFNYLDDSEEAVGSTSFADSVDFAEFDRLSDSEDFDSDEEVPLGDIDEFLQEYLGEESNDFSENFDRVQRRKL